MGLDNLKVAEPFTPRSRGGDPWFKNSPGEEPILAECQAYRELKCELESYADGYIRGQSVLVSGHRGSGKTTLVHKAIEDVQRENKTVFRPLAVHLHGPDLLKEDHRGSSSGFGVFKAEDYDEMAKNALHEVIRALHREYSEELANCFEKRWVKPETVAQLRVELNHRPELSTLRDYWERCGFLSSGVLFADGDQDKGLKELVALHSLLEAATDSADGRKPADQSEGAQKLIHDLAGTVRGGPSLLMAAAGLLSAAVVVGLVLSVSHNSIMAVVGGGITGLVTTVLLSYFGGRTKQQSLMVDATVATMDITLPILVRRVLDSGLAPVFVVDELDKVQNLEKRLNELIQRVKHLTGDCAFFCFITDRNYYQHHRERLRENAYPVEHTFFKRILYVHYSPSDLHAYLKRLLDQSAVKQADSELLEYLVLHKARCHLGDLQRWLKHFTVSSAEFDSRTAQIGSQDGRCLAVLVQLAVEIVYYGKDVQNRLLDDPLFGQLVYDALYFPSRAWGNGQPLFSVRAEDFQEAMLFRQFSVGGMLKEIAKADQTFLFEKMIQVAKYLEQPAAIPPALRNPPHAFAVRAAALALAEEMVRLQVRLLQDIGESSYLWLYDEYGRSLEDRSETVARRARAENEQVEIEGACSAILNLRLLLLDFSNNKVDIDRIIEFCRPLERSYQGEWKPVYESIDRFRKNGIIVGDYQEIHADEEVIRGFYLWLNSVSQRLCYAIFCAWMLKHDLYAGLTAVADEVASQELALDLALDKLQERLRTLVPVVVMADHHRAFVLAEVGIARWTDPMRRFLAGSRTP